MGRSFITGGGQSFMNTLTTVYCAIGSGDVENNITTEAARQTPFRSAGKIEKLYFRTPAVSGTGVFVVRIRINGANGNLAITTPAGTSGHFIDDDPPDTIAVADLVNYSLTLSAGDGWPTQMGCVFNADDGTVTRLHSSTGGSASKSSVSTEYMPIAGVQMIRSTEADVRGRFSLNGTWKGLYVYIVSNARTATTNYRARKNGGNGNQVVSVLTTATGRFQDTSNTDTVAKDDELNYSIEITSGSGAINCTHIGSEIVTTDGTYMLVQADGDYDSINRNVTEYNKMGGSLNFFSTWHWNYLPLPGMVTNYVVLVRANTIDVGTSTFEVYRPQDARFIAIQIPPLTTGMFENDGDALFHDLDTEVITKRMRTSTTATTGSISWSYSSTKHWPFERRANADGVVQPVASIPHGLIGYTVADTTFSMHTLTGAATSLTIADEALSAWITLPFTFNFFGNPKYQLRVCDNGFVRFSGTSTAGGFPGFVASATSSQWMGDCIAAFGTDLDPGSGGTIKYETFGSNPNRIFVIEWNAVPYWDNADTVTFQLKLFESDGHIEIHIQDGSNDPLYWNCSGVMSPNGVPFFRNRTFVDSGYRFESVITNEATSFTPIGTT